MKAQCPENPEIIWSAENKITHFCNAESILIEYKELRCLTLRITAIN